MRRFLPVLLIFGVAFYPLLAQAVLPADIVVNIGSQMSYFVSVTFLLLGGFTSSLFLALRTWFISPARWLMSFLVVVIVLALGGGAFLFFKSEFRKEAQLAIELQEVQSQNSFLQQQLLQSVPEEEYQKLRSLLETGTLTESTSTLWLTSGRSFFSDTVVLYGTRHGQPFTIEVDVNRRENVRGVFTQYAFLNGTISGVGFEDYSAVQTATSTIEPDGFISYFERTKSLDLLTRDKYAISISVLGKPMKITLGPVEGDFITKDDPAYTRYQSAATALVEYEGEEFSLNALVEGVHAMDYQKYIFFAGRESVRATTHQFVLWDENGSFYLVDESVTHSGEASYPSHIWVLYKQAPSRLLKKSFQANITENMDDLVWRLAMPEVNGAIVNLKSDTAFKNEAGRGRFAVSGTISDDQGTRAIRGILHRVE